jgi:hypothetical protein
MSEESMTLAEAIERMQERAEQLDRGKRPGLSLGACFRDAEAIQLLIAAAEPPTEREVEQRAEIEGLRIRLSRVCATCRGR